MDGSAYPKQSETRLGYIRAGRSDPYCTTFFFSNDLSLYVYGDVRITQYADDTQILVTGRKRDIRHLIHHMESALCTLFQWFGQNQMKVNSQKTQLIVLGTRQMLLDLPRLASM